MEFVIQFGLALLLLAAVAYLTRRRAYADGDRAGYARGRAEQQQLSYHEGYTTGVYEGRLKAKLEAETTIQKAQLTYEQGWADALHAVECETYAAMAESNTTIRLSA